MNYNFDEIINRNGTDSVKWDGVEGRWGRNDLIPMWVADMDFRTAPFVIEALKKRLEHEVLGYPLVERTSRMVGHRRNADVYSRHCSRVGFCYPLFHGKRR